MNFGLTETGFSLKRLPDILDEINTELRAQFGTDINLDPDSVLGQFAGTFSKGEADVWELLEAAYHSQFRVSAEGEHLNAVGELIHVFRAEGESDSDYRERMLRLPKKNNLSTAEGMRHRILIEVDGAKEVFVLTADDSSDSLVTGNKIEVIVEGGNDAEVARKIWQVKPAGIELYAHEGTPVGPVTIVDDDGYPHEVKFSRVKQRNIRVTMFVSPTDSDFPHSDESWIDQIKAGLVALGNSYGVGQSLVAQQFYGPAFQIPGIDEVSVLIFNEDNDDNSELWNSETPGDGTITIHPYEKASFSIGNIDVGSGP